MGVDGKVIGLSEKFSIEGLMQGAAARAGDAAPGLEPEDDGGADAGDLPPIERLSLLPMPGDPYTNAHARPSNKPLATLTLVKGDGTLWSYPYSCCVEGPHLVYANDAARNLVVVLTFSGIRATEVTLAGRKMEQLVNYLCHHRVAWVREQPIGKIIRDHDAPVITGITIRNPER